MALELALNIDSDSAIPYTRLHITPFDLSLQSLVIPSSVLPRARNISYHTIETFPEKRFGFVDLPTMDAEKIKKKLNGAVLKGAKVRVDTARPEPVLEPAVVADTTMTKRQEGGKKSKKRKREANIIEGVQLEDRKIKRGWTTTDQEMIQEKRTRSKKEKKEKRDDNSSKDENNGKSDERDKKKKKNKEKKTGIKSKYTDEPECLFKTRLPNTSAPKEPREVEGGEGVGEEEDASTHRKKRKRKGDRVVVVHEFERTTKYPTFIKSNADEASAESTTFEDGVGWVDGSGKVVEPVKSKGRAGGISALNSSKVKKTVQTSAEESVAEKEKENDDDDSDETSSSGSSSDESDINRDVKSNSDATGRKEKMVTPPNDAGIEASTSNSPSAITKLESGRPKSSSSITSLSIKIPPTTPTTKRVHPLEALYKKPQGKDSAAGGTPEAKPFSFFDNDEDIEDDVDSVAASQAPMTPYTKQELDFRNIRSAAPTPDTAHPSRSFNFWPSHHSEEDGSAEEDNTRLEKIEEGEQTNDREEDDDNNEDDVDMVDGVAGGQADQTPASDFQKQFWESRGDLNRAWRKRRKSAAKEKRYRDNRARAERAI